MEVREKIKQKERRKEGGNIHVLYIACRKEGKKEISALTRRRSTDANAPLSKTVREKRNSETIPGRKKIAKRAHLHRRRSEKKRKNRSVRTNLFWRRSPDTELKEETAKQTHLYWKRSKKETKSDTTTPLSFKEKKYNKKEEIKGSRIDNENALIVTLVTMASNLTANADPRLDKKLDHVLREFLLAKGVNHKTRQMFKENNIYQFEDFIDYTVEDLEDLRRILPNSTKGFSRRKVTQIYKVIRYYNSLQDADATLEDDPENWAMPDFRLWIDNGRHPTFTSANATSSSTNANPIWRQARQVGTATTTTTAPKVVSDEEVFLNVNVVTKEDANSILNGVAAAAAAAAVVDNDDFDKDGSSNLIVIDTDDDEIDNSKIQSNAVAVPTTTTVPTIGLKEEKLAPGIHAEIASNEFCVDNAASEDVLSNLNVTAAANDNIDNVKLTLGRKNSFGDLDGIQNEYYQVKGNSNDDETATTTVISREIVSTEDVNSNKICTKIRTDIASNEEYISISSLDDVTAAATADATADDDDIVNAKSPPKFKDLTGDLRGIKDKYYQIKGSNKDDEADVGYDGVPGENDNYGLIYDRSDDINPPPLPPESPVYTTNIPCIHSSIPNNGERIVLPSLVS